MGFPAIKKISSKTKADFLEKQENLNQPIVEFPLKLYLKELCKNNRTIKTL